MFILVASTQLSGIVATTVRTLQPDKVIHDVAHFITILAIYITRSSNVGERHWLHPYCGVEEGEIFCHIFRTSLAQRTCVVITSHIHQVTVEVHNMPAIQSTKGFCAFKHGIMTDGAVSLQSLWDTMMMVVRQRYTCITAHTVTVIDAQALARSTHITEWTVVDGFVGSIIIEIANVAMVSREGFPFRLAFRIHTFVTSGLQCAASHAQDLLHFIPVQLRVFVFVCHLTSLFTAETTCVEAS
jgi:hypothetical protein